MSLCDLEDAEGVRGWVLGIQTVHGIASPTGVNKIAANLPGPGRGSRKFVNLALKRFNSLPSLKLTGSDLLNVWEIERQNL